MGVDAHLPGASEGDLKVISVILQGLKLFVF